MTQFKKKKKKESKKERKNGRQVLEKKRQFSMAFYTSILSTAREMPKNKRKNHDKMC